jgi:hypothetical protein
MKGDFSRKTFVKEKHYSGVFMQQGRVLLDADWNEQVAIQHNRITAETRDLVGPCGAPAENPGFRITVKEKTLLIDKGHYYVDGILCENEKPIAFDKQPDLYDPPEIFNPLKESSSRLGLVYLDVWHRHITALEDSRIHEKALGDADSATRGKTVWQVKIDPIKIEISDPAKLAALIEKRNEIQQKLPQAKSNPAEESHLLADLAKIAEETNKLLKGFSCSSYKWEGPVAPSTGKLNARSQQASKSQLPCIVPPGAGYRRLENQLYRVEIHEGGALNVPGIPKKPTFIWSRENGSVVTEWSGQSGSHNEVLEVANTGRDSVLGFSADQWIELTDDKHELDGKPGTLVKISQVKGNELTIDYNNVYPSGASYKRSDFSRNPKIRRWDSASGPIQVNIPSANDGFIKLGDDGVEIKFSSGTYRTGDYWVIPARTNTGDVEWPPNPQPGADPFQLPFGIHHHYCRLAVVFVDDKDNLLDLMDCRKIFPPLTGLNQFYYAGGDGQEAMPDYGQPNKLVALSEPLRVGVSNWHWPVAGVSILFQITKGNGKVQNSGPQVFVSTGLDGIAACSWQLDPVTADQEVVATLLDEDGNPLQNAIYFHANLSIAEEVAFDPKNTPNLSDAYDVQTALERLAGLVAQETEQCCVIVDGKTMTLDKAWEYALRGSVCLCLLPGKHVSERKDVLKPEKNFDLILRGCAGAQVYMRNPLSFSGFSSLVAYDLDFTMDNPDASKGAQAFFSVESCERVRFENCRLFSNGINGTLLQIGRSGQAYLVNNILDAKGAARKASLNRVFEGMDFAGILDVEDATRARKAAEALSSKIVSDLKPTERKALAQKTHTAMEANRNLLTAPEVALIESVTTVLAARRPNKASIAAAIEGIYTASKQSTQNTALVLGIAGKAMLVDNQVRGTFVLYGPPAEDPPGADRIPALLKSLRSKEFRFREASGELHLRGNRFMQIQVSAETIVALNDQKEPPDIFYSLHCSDNSVRQGSNFIAAGHFVSTSNAFEAMDQNAVGCAVTNTAIFVGNRGPNSDALFWVYSQPNCMQKTPDPQLLVNVVSA